MRVAVVGCGDYPSWDDRSAILSHFVGALACIADVELLVGEGSQRRSDADGAATRETFPARPPDPGRLRALELLAFEPQSSARVPCDCMRRVHQDLVRDLPDEIGDELVVLSGGDSPALVEHLAASDYDLVVFTRPDTASTAGGLDAVCGRIPTLLLPLVQSGPRLLLPAVRRPFAVADCVAVTSAYEASIAAEAGASRITTIGSVLRVHPLAHRNEPVSFEDRAVVVVRDWARHPPGDELVLTVRRLNRDLDGSAIVRLIGPGWEILPADVRGTHADSRLDVWRWVARSIALWDPEPHRLLGREVLEAMQYGTPVVTSLHGAAQEHAAEGNGGLWYRTYDELRGCVEALATELDLRKALGAQGRAYAVQGFADTDAYIARVERLVVELVGRSR